MKKLLFLISLLTILGGANSVKAGKTYGTLKAIFGATWEANTMTWQSSNLGDYTIIGTGLSETNITAYTKFHATLSNFSENADFVRLRIKDKSGNYADANLIVGDNNIDLNTLKTSFPSCDFSNLEDITIWGGSATEDHEINAGNPASVEITDCYLYKPTTISFNSSGVATIPVTEIVATGGFSISSTGVVTCDGTAGTLEINFNPSVDLTSLKRYDVVGPGNDQIIWRSIMNTPSTTVLAYYGSRWGGNLTGAERAKATAVNKLFWESNNNTQLADVAEGDRTFTITSITLTADAMSVVNAHDVPIASLTHYNLDKDANVSVGSSISTNFEIATDTPLGDGNDDNDEYIDIEDYDELRIYTSEYAENEHPRVFFFNATKPYVAEVKEEEKVTTTGTYKTKGQTVYLDNSIFAYNSDDNYYYARIVDIKSLCNGNAKVIGVKKRAWNSGAITVNKIQVYKENPTYDYILSGQYSASVDISTVTSDASATAIDCSTLSGNNVTITPSNPNCMFKARAGVLANNKNVIVDGECAKLELTDGYTFKAPENFTATAASYSRNLGSAGAGTLCLPFESAIPGGVTGVTAYTLNYTLGKDKAKATGVAGNIPANTPVLLNGTGSATFSGSGAVVAGASNEYGALTGVFKATTVPQDSYVLQDGDNGIGFYLVNSDDIIANPFRAYLTADGAGARSITIEYDDVTGVNDVKAKNDISKGVYYNLSGQRVSKPTKGLFIVDGKVVRF